MQTTGSRREVVITVIPEPRKRPVDLRFGARAEIREHIAECRRQLSALPADDSDQEPGGHGEPATLTSAELTAVLGRLDARALARMLSYAHGFCAEAVESTLVLCQDHGGTFGPADCDACAAARQPGPEGTAHPARHCGADWTPRPSVTWHCALDSHEGAHKAVVKGRVVATWDASGGQEYPEDQGDLAAAAAVNDRGDAGHGTPPTVLADPAVRLEQPCQCQHARERHFGDSHRGHCIAPGCGCPAFMAAPEPDAQPAAEQERELLEKQAADVIAESIATGRPVIVEDDEPQAVPGHGPEPRFLDERLAAERKAAGKCPAHHPTGPWWCIRDLGHDGDHYGTPGAPSVWPQGLICRNCKSALALDDDVLCGPCDRAPDLSGGPAAPEHHAVFPAVPFLPAEMLLTAGEASGAPCKCGHGDHGHEQPDSDDGQPGGCIAGEPPRVAPLIVPGMVIPADGEARPFPAIGAAS
jgi:hypothetical protein